MKRIFVILFLLLATSAHAQTFKVTNQGQHPYKHKPRDLSTDATMTGLAVYVSPSDPNAFRFVAPPTGSGTGDMTKAVYDTNANDVVDSVDGIAGSGVNWTDYVIPDTSINWAIQVPLNEDDPQVGTLTNTKWCTTDGNVINCEEAAPAGSGDMEKATYDIDANDIVDLAEGVPGAGVNWTDYVVPDTSINWAAQVPLNEDDPLYSAWIAGPPNVSEFTNNSGYLDSPIQRGEINWTLVQDIQSGGINWSNVEVVAPITEAMVNDLGAYLTAEDDPQVGKVTDANDFCVGDGDSVECDITPNAGTDITADLEEEVTEGSLADSTIVSADIKDATITGSDLASNIAITSTGVQDYGGATSFEIPNGGPTVDAAGEIGVDTTSDQLIYYGGAKSVVTGDFTDCRTIEDPTDADDNIPLWNFKRAVTITDVYCEVDGGTSVDLTLSDGTNALEAITCDGDGAEDDGSIANGTFTARERIEMDLANTSGTNTWLIICVTFTTTAD